MGDKLGVLTSIDGWAFSHIVDGVEVANGPNVLDTVMAKIPSAVDGAPLVVGLQMVQLFGKMELPQFSIFVNTKTRGSADYYFQPERRFRTRTIIWDRGDSISSYGDDGAILSGGSPIQNDDGSYMHTNIPQSVTRIDSQDGTTLSPSVSEDAWEHVTNYNVGGIMFSDIYQHLFEDTAGGLDVKKWGLLGSAAAYDYGGVIIPGFMPQSGFGIFDASPITVAADETTASATGTAVSWNEYDSMGAFIGNTAGGASSQFAILSDEWLPSNTATQISDMLAYLAAQDIASIWAGAPLPGLGGVEYRFPLKGHQLAPPEKWPNAQDAAFLGPDHVIGGIDYADVTTIGSVLTSTGADHGYDGAIYPGSDNDGTVHNIGNFAPPAGIIFTAPPSPGGGDYQVAAYRTTRKLAVRAQVKSLGARINYTVIEVINTIDVDGATTYINQWFFHQIGSGVLLPGAFLELPPPSRTDLPFISTSGGTSVCARYVDVLFVPMMTIEEFVAAFDAGDGAKTIVAGF
jgi:hypothetical protein